MDRTRTSRSRLFIGTAGLALAAALAAAPQQVRAQVSGGAFNANPEIIAGDVLIDRGTPSVDTITVSTPTAVIDWFPFEDLSGNALTFLPDGNTAFFQDAPGQGGFAVLNRILPSTNNNIVIFDGRVVSQLQDISGNFTPGGFVAFYSPTGILVGSTAVFDVGQLLLTTLDVDPLSFDTFYTQGGALTLNGPFGIETTAGVIVEAGAQINAPSEESFFIAAGPQVIMSGDARINGSTAYVAGIDMTIGYANGLFDIAIQTGTTIGNALVHDGSTGGPASTGVGDNHVIYGVAASNFDPITMLFGGNLGFDPAVSATIENGDIILAANYNVSGRSVAGGDVSNPAGDFFGGSQGGFGQADISILPGTYTSRFTAVGTDRIQATALTGGITFTGDATLIARQSALMLAGNNFLLEVGGNARVDASNAGITGFPSLPSDLDGIGGTASIAAETGGLVTIAGDALVQANGFAGYDTSSGTGGNGTGGIAEIVAIAGTVDVGGSATVNAFAGGFDTPGILSSGAFTGGDAHILVDGGSVDIAGDALVDAGASSTTLLGLGAQAGGATAGGLAQIGTLGTGGSIVIGGSAVIDATAFGQAAGSASLTPALVTGGQASLFTGSNGTIDIGIDANLLARAEGRDNGADGPGGSAVGGQAIIQSNGVSITIGGGVELDSSAAAGDSGSTQGVFGGDATGGFSSIDASSGTIAITGAAFLESDGTGGNGGIDGGSGGTGTAGRSQVVALGTGSITLGSAFLQSIGNGGFAIVENDNGGAGNGGESELLTDGGSIVVTGQAQLFAEGSGGDGENGGAATSGLAGAYAITGSIDIGGDFTAGALAFGGSGTLGFGGQGGNATGGTAYLQADGTNTVGASLTVGGVANLGASGFGGVGGAGDGSAVVAGSGGIGTGGTFQGVQGSGGVFALAGRDTGTLELGGVTMSSNGTGGAGGAGGAGGTGQSGGAGGDGFGGTVQAGTFVGRGDGTVGGGNASFGSILIFATGTGGTGGSGQTQGIGGDGTGGFGAILAQGSIVTAGPVQIRADGTGRTGSTGGDGTGGNTGFGVTEGGSMTLASLLSQSTGAGGVGLAGNGGQGVGGVATGDYDGNFDVTGNLTFAANGFGGASSGGTAGGGLGGLAAFRGMSGSANVGGTLVVHADGSGGTANSVDGQAGGGTGGDAIASVIGGATMNLGAAQVSAGGRGGSGPAAAGGTGTGGNASLTAADAGSAITITGFTPASLPTPTSVDPALVAAWARGGDTNGGTGVGGAAQGGTTLISASAGGSITLAADGPGGLANFVVARATAGNSSVAGGIGGSAAGGDSTTIADNGTIAADGFIQSSFAQGGSSANAGVSITGGDATGGTRSIVVRNGATFSAGMPGGGSGAQGGNGSGAGNGGNATGGLNEFIVDASSVTLFGPNNFFAGPVGGSGAIGGNAIGGQVVIDIRGGANVTMIGNPTDGPGLLSAGVAGNVARGGDGTTRGGDATADTIAITIADSTVSGALAGFSHAYGGSGGSGGLGGDATSSGISFLATNSTLTLGDGNIFSALAVGGDGATGGDAFGGGAGVVLDIGSVVTVATGTAGISVSDEARGGAGTTSGGNATGGAVSFALLGGSSAAMGPLSVTTHATGGVGGIGGIGAGGQALVNIAAGTQLDLASLVVSALGTGGAGTSGLGGPGDGGDATVDYSGLLTVAGDANIIASGTGGASTGGAAGAGQGGIAALRGTAGSADVGGTLFVTAHGFGGDAQSAGETAGDGTGGSALASVTGGTTMTLGAAQISAGGQGGTGPAATGGNGLGGSAAISSAGGDITILGFAPPSSGITPAGAMLSAFGVGGDTTGGTGIGGAGSGGITDVTALGGGSITLADDGPGGQSNTVISGGLGGTSSVDGGIGGSASGGASRIVVDGGTLAVGEYNQSSFAQGGSSANSGLSITGGDADGGDDFIRIESGGNLTGTLSGGPGAQGGNGSGAGSGGNAVGGTNTFAVDGASATLFGTNSFFAGATGGSGAVGGNATGGVVNITFRNAQVEMIGTSGGPGVLGAGAAATGGAGVSQGGNAVGDLIDIEITDSTFSGAIDALSQATGGNASSGRGGDANASPVELIANGSTITLTGDSRFAALATGGSGATGGDASGGRARVVLDGGSNLTMGAAAGTLTISDEVNGGTGTTSGGAATGDTATFLLLGASTASVEQLRVTTAASASGGDVVGGFALLRALENSTGTFGTADVQALATTSAPGSAVQGDANVDAQTGGSLDIGSLAVQTSDAFIIGAPGGTMTLGNLTLRSDGLGASEIRAVGGSIPITGILDISVAGDLTFTTGQGGIIGGPSVSAPTAIINIDAGGTVTFVGDNDAAISVGGQAMTITSTELDIRDGARIGAETLNLNVRANGDRTVAGGDTEEAGYTLLQEEIERIEAGDAHFRASFDGAASDDLLIRDLTISGSADDGTRSVNIGAGGVVRVEGTLAYIDAIATDSLGIEANRLEIVTPGGIGVVDSGGAPTGSFEFYGNDFWMADADTIAQLQEDVGFAGRDDLLAGVVPGSDDPLGYLRAGNVEFYIVGGGSLLTRNTGTADAPGGITVTGSLEIETGQALGPLDVFAYGRLLNADGSFVTGADFFRLVNFNRTAGPESQAVTYTDASMFNDCVINTPECGVVEPPAQVPPIVTSPKTVLGPLSVPLAPAILGPGPAEKNEQFGLFFPGLIQTSPPGEAEVIDDPVTSGGDSALFGFSEQTEGSAAEECEVDQDGVNGEECDDQ